MNCKKILAGALSAATLFSCLTFGPSGTVSAAAVVNNDFDISYDGWTNNAPMTILTATANSAFNSARGMLVSGRTTPSDGAVSNKGFYLDGGKAYDYNIKLRSDSDAVFSVSVSFLDENGTAGADIIGTAKAEAGEWIDFSESYTAPEGVTDITICITTDGTDNFSFDDVQIIGTKNAGMTVSAATSEVGLKDVYANYFKFGCCVNSSGVNNSTTTALVLREFNSITFENELKPDSTLNQYQSSSSGSVAVSLSSAASLLDFCANNNIPVRGHCLVWHSQTPDWFFKENFNANGNWVSISTMNTRMEQYIKLMFQSLAQQYPNVDLYAYDVVNEAFQDGAGSLRTAGSNNVTSGTSAWMQIYGNDTFIYNAFKYAKIYAPSDCKLFYNDFNEYIDSKRDAIYTLCLNLYSNGLLDGIGMQSHLSTTYPSASLYSQALAKYSQIGCEIQVTELDITTSDTSSNGLQTQATVYQQILEAIVEYSDYVTAVVVWGTTDDSSWRASQSPLLFNSSYQKKAAYNSIVSLIPESMWGDGSTGGGEVVTLPDEDGCYFHSTYESNYDGWSTRGDDSVTLSSGASYAGAQSLLVSGRTSNWNGTGKTLNGKYFVGGNNYSFSAIVMCNTGAATEDFSLTLQYTSASGETSYSNIATVTADNGEWALLQNTQYTIPDGATELLIYVETPTNLIDFYVDEAIGAVAGTENLAFESTEPGYILGDVTGDGSVDVRDVAKLAKAAAGTLTLTDAERLAGDVTGDGNIDVRDVARLAKAASGVLPL